MRPLVLDGSAKSPKKEKNRRSRNKNRTLSGRHPAAESLVARGESCWRIKDCATAHMA